MRRVREWNRTPDQPGRQMKGGAANLLAAHSIQLEAHSCLVVFYRRPHACMRGAIPGIEDALQLPPGPLDFRRGKDSRQSGSGRLGDPGIHAFSGAAENVL